MYTYVHAYMHTHARTQMKIHAREFTLTENIFKISDDSKSARKVRGFLQRYGLEILQAQLPR